MALAAEWIVFQGFRGQNGVLAAQSEVGALMAAGRGLEQVILLEAITAYVDVWTDRRLVALGEAGIDLIEGQHRVVEARFAAGEATQLDVAALDAQRRTADAQLALATLNAQSSAVAYVNVMGALPPADLETPAAVDGVLPPLNRAVEAALSAHPALVEARYRAEMAGANVAIVEGALLPEVRLFGTVGVGRTGTDPWAPVATIGIQATIPLYGGGGGTAAVRAAQANRSTALTDVGFLSNQVTANISLAIDRLDAVGAQLEAAEALVAATDSMRRSNREQQRLGLATAMDVLVADQAGLRAQQSLVEAIGDQVVASYAVLSAIGLLSVETLGLVSAL